MVFIDECGYHRARSFLELDQAIFYCYLLELFLSGSLIVGDGFKDKIEGRVLIDAHLLDDDREGHQGNLMLVGLKLEVGLVVADVLLETNDEVRVVRIDLRLLEAILGLSLISSEGDQTSMVDAGEPLTV